MYATRLALLFLALFSAPLLAQETINSFDARLEVQPDGSIQMHETVNVTAGGKVIKRGITRAITRRPIGGGKTGTFDYRVTDVQRDGQGIDHFDKQTSGVHTFYLGSKNKTLDEGDYTFDFRYVSDDQVYQLDTLDEVRWHLIDTDGTLPVEAAEMQIVFPAGTTVSQAACLAGAEGSRERACTVEMAGNVATFTLTRALRPGEGMTVAAGIPVGYFPRPAPPAGTPTGANGLLSSPSFSTGIPETGLGSFGTAPADNSQAAGPPPTLLQRRGTLYALLIGLSLAFIYAYRAWDRYGRDPEVQSPEFVYYPPEDLSPALAADQASALGGTGSIPAGLTALAIRGLLQIEEETKKQLLGTGKTYFVLTQTERRPAPDELPAEEAVLYERLFLEDDRIELDGKYNSHLAHVQRAFAKSVREQNKAFHAEGRNVQLYWPLLGILLTTLAVAGYFLIGAPKSSVAYFVGGLVTALVGFTVYAVAIAQPSRDKVARKQELAALKNYLKLPRKKRDRLPNAPEMTEEYYQQLLPYAIAFGIDNTWAQDLAGDWGYTANRPRQQNTYAILYASNFNREIHTGFSSTAAQPSSSGGSSGGGFSGGGGSVGGGGGGTGGF